MKKKMVVGAAALAVVLASVTAFAFFGDELSFQPELPLEEQLQAVEESTQMSLEAEIEDPDLVTLLRNQGMEDDEVERAINRYSITVALYEPTAAETSQIVGLVEEGYDLYQLSRIYDFLVGTQEGSSILEEIYDMGEKLDFQGRYWIEDAYNAVTNNVHGVLGMEEVGQYISQGLSVADIRVANEMSRTGAMTIQEILEERLDGTGWTGLFQQAYGDDTVSKLKLGSKADGPTLIQSVNEARISKVDANTVYKQVYAENNEAKSIINIKLKAASEFMTETKAKLKTQEQIISSNAAQIAQKGLTEEEVAKYKNRGLLMKEIMRGADIANATGIDLDRVLERYQAENLWYQIPGEEADGQ